MDNRAALVKSYDGMRVRSIKNLTTRATRSFPQVAEYSYEECPMPRFNASYRVRGQGTLTVGSPSCLRQRLTRGRTSGITDPRIRFSCRTAALQKTYLRGQARTKSIFNSRRYDYDHLSILLKSSLSNVTYASSLTRIITMCNLDEEEK